MNPPQGTHRAKPFFARRRYFDGHAELGAIYSPECTVFRVFAPSAERVKVVVADGLAGADGLAEHAMSPTGKGIWEATIPGDLEGKCYAYKLTGPELDPDREVVDIYATCTQSDASRSLIVDLRKTDPPGFRESHFDRPGPLAGAIIYELHVRDFTMAASSGVRHHGRYLGLTETGTHLPRHPAVSTGLDHLKALGVTHVQLMPVQHYDRRNVENDSTYNWGYMPVHFNSPEGWLASSAEGSAKCREFKAAVQTLHEAGIGVIMDVVYNHTSDRASFEKLVPGYYYRMDRKGGFANGSGCGNEFRSQSPMARKFILDSLKFWVREYQVDGFRFDVMALLDIDTMKQVRSELSAIDPGILVYGEPWAAGPSPLRKRSDKLRTRGTGIGAFNDGFRDAIKGERDDESPGFIQAGDRADDVRRGLAGIADDWPLAPADSVNYFECHDNLTAWDKLLKSVPDVADEVHQRMMRFGALILLTSQGAVFLQAGQEFCRTKQGHHNSYNSGDEINQIDWSRKLKYADVCDYFRGLIALRRRHPVFRLASREQVERRVIFRKPPTPRCLVSRLRGRGLEGEPADWVLLLLNGESDETTFKLPPGRWAVHADADHAGRTLRHASGRVTLPAHSGMMLIR